MVTKKKPSIYDCIKGSPILTRGEKLVPFTCFDVKRDWNEIGKEYYKILEKYKMFLPEFDFRSDGDVIVGGKKRKKVVHIDKNKK